MDDGSIVESERGNQGSLDMTHYKVKQLGKWWIIGDEEYGPIGPYDTQTEANQECRGLNRFERHQNEPDFISVENVGLKRDVDV